MENSTDAPFALKPWQPKPKKPPPYKRPPREPKPTRRDREIEHDHYAWTGGRDPTGTAFARPITPDEEWFRHHNWRDKRLKVAAALAAAGTSPQSQANFANCGSECIIEWSDAEGRYRLRGNYCHSRHCEPCMKSKANLLAANLRNKLDEHSAAQFRFITLTLRHNDKPLKEQIKRLNNCFRKLRGSKCWKQSQFGGAAMLEVKYDAKSKRWHPHLHIVSQGVYLDKHELSTAWHRATSDSFVVDIRQLHHARDAAYYVAKYVTKGTNDDVWANPEVAVEWVQATKGVRSCATYGKWRGYKLLGKPKTATDWRAINFLSAVASRARAGSEVDRLLIELLRESFQYDPHAKRPKSSG